MDANEVIGKWAVKKGLLDCWHEVHRRARMRNRIGTVRICNKCDKDFTINPDYSIYENMEPIVKLIYKEHRLSTDAILSSIGWSVAIEKSDKEGILLWNVTGTGDCLPRVIAELVAELISKGEV
jgi:hypothetical protein